MLGSLKAPLTASRPLSRAILAGSLVLTFGCGEKVPPPGPAAGLDTTSPVPTEDTQAATAPDITRREPRPPPQVVLPDGWKSITRDAITVAISRDSALLVGGDLAGYTAFWERSTGVFKWGDLASAGRIRHVRCAEQADTCVAGGFDEPEHVLRRYSTAPLESTTFSDIAAASVKALALSADGTLAATLILKPDAELVIFGPGAEDRPFARSVAPATAGAIALSPDGALLAWAPNTGGVQVFRVATPKAPPEWTGADDTTFAALVWSTPEGGPVTLLAAEGATILEFVLTEGSPTLTMLRRSPIADDRYAIRDLHRVTGGGLFAVTRPPTGGLVLWDAKTATVAAELATRCPCETHALSFDGASAACSCADQAEVRHGPAGLKPAGSAPEDVP